MDSSVTSIEAMVENSVKRFSSGDFPKGSFMNSGPIKPPMFYVQPTL